MEQQITGHYKNLSYEEWLEGAAAFIRTARMFIRRARRGIFGREDSLRKATLYLARADECLDRAMVELDINDFF
jgi:hypothetical protein